ncbi:MAG TPA: outer membrane beta-barrel protein [Steroidobacteraceae bacterium]|nr:outer membrane beta-barrel protein [Steroidobacteraceae bacterium]
MNDRFSASPFSLRSVFVLPALILCSLGTMSVAHADDPLGLYVGASYGQAHIRVQSGEIALGNGRPLPGLDMTHAAFKGIIGIRPISFLGAEVSYMDFGTVSTVVGQALQGFPAVVVSSERATQKGEAAFALLYLPVPVVDVYVKAGVSRITTDFSAAYTTTVGGICGLPCNTFQAGNVAVHDTTDTAFAYGAGLQWKLGQWAVRGEYERFDAAGANPSLFSIGMTLWF